MTRNPAPLADRQSPTSRSVAPDPAAVPTAAGSTPPADFQHRVADWVLACFGPEIAADGVERNHRFLEEALELVQALGCTASEARQLVDYTFSRPIGEPGQEVGGVAVTLAALCSAHGISLTAEAEREVARIWTKVDAIRAKQAAKPRHSPLPAIAGPRLVILESPFAGDVEANVAYARAAMADCLRRGEAPIASHLLYTQPGVLDDDKPDERTLGIEAGLAWGRVGEAAVFYVDRGWSRGMLAAEERHLAAGLPIEKRSLNEAIV